jgi:hypothetical protein
VIVLPISSDCGEKGLASSRDSVHINVEELVWKPPGLEVLGSKNRILIPPATHGTQSFK